MADWNSVQYLKFRAERTQPSIDLANRLEMAEPRDILDMGCGPGNSTQVLRDRYPGARILGIDSSENMIEAARQSYPDMEFTVCDAGRELNALGRTFDIVFSNACIQWIPDHPSLLRSMMDILKPGGTMAVQLPMNDDEPIHQIISQVSQSPRWRDEFRNPRVFYTLSQEEYFDLLAALSRDFTLWQTTYLHRLPSHEAIMDWYRGTGLRPYLNALVEPDRSRFQEEILKEVIRAYPVQKNGEILFRFPRLFFLATRG